MTHPPLSIEQILTQLEQNPKRIARLTAKCKPAQLQAPTADDEWSANDVLAHLRACNDVWGTAILKILAGDTATLRIVSPRTWMRKTDHIEQEFRSSLRAFATQRTELVRALKPLKPKDWQRSAPVLKDGKTRERSVLSFAEHLVNHEGQHVAQIERMVTTIGKQR